MSTDIKLSKAQTSKIIQYGGFLGSSLLRKIAGSLMKEAVPLAKNTLALLGTTAASVVDAGIKKIHVSGKKTTFIVSNDELNDILKFV